MEKAFDDLVWHLEEPRVGQSYPNFYASKLASKFNKVILTGIGGDELFAGYPWRYYKNKELIKMKIFIMLITTHGIDCSIMLIYKIS